MRCSFKLFDDNDIRELVSETMSESGICMANVQQLTSLITNMLTKVTHQ